MQLLSHGERQGRSVPHLLRHNLRKFHRHRFAIALTSATADTSPPHHTKPTIQPGPPAQQYPTIQLAEDRRRAFRKPEQTRRRWGEELTGLGHIPIVPARCWLTSC